MNGSQASCLTRQMLFGLFAAKLDKRARLPSEIGWKPIFHLVVTSSMKKNDWAGFIVAGIGDAGDCRRQRQTLAAFTRPGSTIPATMEPLRLL